MSPQTERRLPDSNEPLTDWEKALLEKFFADPSQLPAKFKSWVTDYVSTNGSFNVSSLPTLRGEEWREIGATGQPAFANSWVNYGLGWETAAFYKDPLGVVRVRGLVKNGTLASVVFTLPEGYRPPSTAMFACLSHDGVNFQHTRVDVATSGGVNPVAPASNVFLSLNFSFRAS